MNQMTTVLLDVAADPSRQLPEGYTRQHILDPLRQQLQRIARTHSPQISPDASNCLLGDHSMNDGAGAQDVNRQQLRPDTTDACKAVTRHGPASVENVMSTRVPLVVASTGTPTKPSTPMNLCNVHHGFNDIGLHPSSAPSIAPASNHVSNR